MLDWVSIDPRQVAWWALIAIIVAVAIVAIVFAVLAFGESQVFKPHRNIVRHDMVAKGDLIVDGDGKVDALSAESLQVHKSANLNRLRTASLRFTDIVAISSSSPTGATGTASIQLTGSQTSYRVDATGGAFDLLLPPVSEAPGQLFQVAKSQLGADATVSLSVATGDFFCTDSGCLPASANPVLSLLAGQADQVWLGNDGLSSWKAL
jgi:hypothetical protein